MDMAGLIETITVGRSPEKEHWLRPSPAFFKDWHRTENPQTFHSNHALIYRRSDRN